MANEIMAALQEKINAQSLGKDGKAIFPEAAIGRQLLDIAGSDPAAAELLLRDLDVQEMGLAAAAKKLKEYADKHHGKANCFCITPDVAETIFREFYGLPDNPSVAFGDTSLYTREALEENSKEAGAEQKKQTARIDLSDFF